MERKVLETSNISIEALKFISKNNIDIVNEIIKLTSSNKIVVIGMAQNPVVKKAKKF